MIKLKNVGVIAGISFVVLLAGCNDSPPAPAPSPAPVKETPVAKDASTALPAVPKVSKSSASSSSSKAKTVHSLATQHPYDELSRMVLVIAEKEISSFSLTPSKVTSDGVVVEAGIKLVTDTPLVKDSLIVFIDDNPVTFSPVKDDPYVFIIDNKTIDRMLSAQKVIIDLYVEQNKYFEGNFHSTAPDTFKSRLVELLKKNR